MCLGDLGESLDTVERSLALAAGDRSLGAGLGWTRPYGWAEMWQGCMLAWSGRLAEGQAAEERAFAASREEGDVENQLWAQNILVSIADFGMGDGASALAHARSACELAERAGGVYGQAWSRVFLGAAHLLQEEWAAAVEAFEWALAFARERHSALDGEAWFLARLACARRGAGDVQGAHTAAREALDIALERKLRLHEIPARIELARVLIETEGAAASAEIQEELERALGLVRETGAAAFEPQVHRARAELARAAGDERSAEREMAEVERLLGSMMAAHAAPLQDLAG